MERSFSVIVIGAGAAGICAAIQAARAGVSTLLVEKNGRVGGTTVNALVDFPGLFHAWGRQVIGGIGWEIVARSVREAGLSMPDFQKLAVRHMEHQVRVPAPLFSLIAAEAAAASGAHLLLHSMIAEVEERRGAVEVTVCTKGGLQRYSADVLIDCSGDANALQLAGCAVRMPEEVQPGTLSCRAGGYNIDTLDMDALRKAAGEACRRGELLPQDLSFSPVSVNPESWLNKKGDNSNHIYNVNAFDSEGRTRMEQEAVACLLRTYRFLKKQPGLERLYIECLAAESGVRETVTLIGEDTITVDDYIGGKVWDDALCHSYYPIDLHDRASGLANRCLEQGVVPTVGRGALLPAGRGRLLGAGRCVSSDRLANSALRVQASCMAMGQAAGALAAVAVSTGADLTGVNIAPVRALLRAHGAIVP